MKKEHALRTGILVVTICLAFLLSSCSEQYPRGKDTVLSVGNGRFHVGHCISYSLFAYGEGISIADDLQEYYDDTRESKLYLTSEGGYIVVDYKAETYSQHLQIEDCKQEDQAIFQDDSKFTAFGQQ